jgi:antibiotic biosynthesis monooxygenase (ABM) superfamily enzyme
MSVMFVNLIRFPALREGQEAAFVEWFKRSNDIYRGFPGFVSRRLLHSRDGSYAAVVEHASESTFMAMHTSPEREALWGEVEPLLQGQPEPSFFELVEGTLAEGSRR